MKGRMGQSCHRILMSGAALAVMAIAALPADAMARTKSEAALEARVAQLEALVARLEGQVNASQAQAAQASAQANAATAQLEAKVASWEKKPAPEGFRTSGGTTIKLGGYLKTMASFSRWSGGDVASNSLGRDFHVPSAIPVGGRRESTDSDFTAKQTRLWLNFATDVSGHSLKGYLETDFQTTPNASPGIAGGGTERTTNGYTLALRRAYVQLDGLTVGQDWSTFQNAAVLPESTDYVGASEGTVFVRQPLVRYSHKFGKNVTLHVSAENAETASAAFSSTLAGGAAGLTAVALTENDDDKMPDFAARLNVATPVGDLALAGLYRRLSTDNVITAPGVLTVARGRATGWGVSASGKFPFGSRKQHDLRIMATYGDGIGRYVGLNFAPDMILNGTNFRVATPTVLAGFAALHLGLAPTVRANLIGSYQRVSYPFVPVINAYAPFNKTALSYAGNLFWSPVKAIDLGFEYRHAKRKLVSGLQGTLDRLEFAAKYNF